MTNDDTIRTWDLAVRVFHWSLVFFFALSYMTGEEESPIHVWSGYTILGLILLRLVWGLVGSPNARLKTFLYGPGEVVAYLRGLFTRQSCNYEGHNPAASWMAIALLVSLLSTGFSGLQLYGVEGHGPLADGESSVTLIPSAYADEDHEHDRHSNRGSRARGAHDEGEEFWEEIHEFFANFTLLLIIIHVSGAVVSSISHRENLIKGMITGYRLSR